MVERVFSGTREMPAEYRVGCPVRCGACGMVWDEDDEAHAFTRMDGETYCREGCIWIARKTAYRASMGSVIDLLRAALRESEQMAKDYGMGDDPEDPAEAIDKAIIAVRQFVEGRHGDS